MSDTTQSRPPIVAVGGVVYRYTSQRQVEVLLIKKRHGFWTLPKGRVKAGEPEDAAVAREVDEETGLSGAVGGAVRQVTYEIVKDGKPRCKIVTYYLMRAQVGEIRPGAKERIEQVRWFPIRAALRRIRRGRVRKVVQRAVAMLQELKPHEA